MLGLGIELMERGVLPDWLVRLGVQHVVRQRGREIEKLSSQERLERLNAFVSELGASPVALVPEKANEQHYEVPAEFFKIVLGKRLKYSSALWDASCKTLDDAEEAMLRICAQRAELEPGQHVLELGCGWGSLTLWMAEHFPTSSIVGVSNSNGQREFIESQARAKGLTNVRILTADMNDFDVSHFGIERKFDRVVSVEMFEHMRNYRELLRRISTWLADEGKLFVHIFCHRALPYPYETEGADNWMGRYFFTGGIMPSEELLFHFQNSLHIEHNWRVNGTHYERTARAWMERMDQNRSEILRILASTYGAQEASRWFERWKVFFLACAELFGFSKGEEWFVAHYLFSRAGAQESDGLEGEARPAQGMKTVIH